MNNSTQQPSTSSPISENPQEPEKSFYGKKNWKKWAVIYVVIGALVYAGIYLFLSQKGQKPYSINYNYTQPTTVAQPTTTQGQTVDTSNWKTYINIIT